MKINSRGLPASLGMLQELIVKGESENIRLLLTLLQVRRA